MMTTLRLLMFSLIAFAVSQPLLAKSYELASPGGKIKATVTFDASAGTLSYHAASGATAVLAESPLGILLWKATGKSPIKTTPEVRTPAEIKACFQQYAGYGVKGVKVDFFDRLGPRPGQDPDYEDTQMGLRVRDNLCRIAAGCRLPGHAHRHRAPQGQAMVCGRNHDTQAKH